MEYLSRILMEAGGNQHFRFHPRCKGLKLNHMCFFDDLMLFCMGEANSTMILCESLDIFSVASGLHTNASKSAL